MDEKFKYIVKTSADPAKDIVIETSEHFRNATEIAIHMGLYFANNGITNDPFVNYTLGCRFHCKLPGIIASKVLPEYPKYYYKTKGHDMRVYPLEQFIQIFAYVLLNHTVLEETPEYVSLLVADNKCLVTKLFYNNWENLLDKLLS